MSQNKDLYTPRKKAMPEVPGARFVQHNYHDIGLLDGSFVDKIYISVVEQIDDAIVAECVKIAHEAGLGQHIVLNKKFITDAIREKLERANNDAPAVDAVEVVRCDECIFAKNFRSAYVDCKCWRASVPRNGFCYNGERKMDVEAEG